MISLLSLFVVSLSLLPTANGINICGTKPPTEDDINEAREVTKEWDERISQTISNQTITVDTIWHRIISGDQGNSEKDITNSIVVLNNAFAPHFKFNLIKKTVTDQRYFWNLPSYSDGGMRMYLHEGDCSILNIYSTKSVVAGFAQFPSRCDYQQREDGVIIDYETVPNGTDPLWNEGYNLVHEVGHWLNLFHTFEGGCGYGIGDGINDTPASRLNRGCPQGIIDSCPNEPGNDLIHNFMDYTDDSCRTSFTNGQFTAMKAAWYRYRYSRPSGPTSLPTNTPTVIGATNKPTRVYGGKQFIAPDELKEQVMAYCAAPDTYDTSIYGAIEDWDVSQITTMKNLFHSEDYYYDNGKHACNPIIGKWDVSRVKNFRYMFGHTTFNQDIGAWDVSNGERFKYMFENSLFNQDISSWDVSKNTNFDGMFMSSHFNQDISSWDVSRSTSFMAMFHKSHFNQDINSWNVSKSTKFVGMFSFSLFNKDISSWDVAKSTDFSGMFSSSVFNQNISSWGTSNCVSFNYMFSSSSFNQDVSDWDVSTGVYFNNMFSNNRQFDQDISSWDVTNGKAFNSMMEGTKSFNQNISRWNLTGGTNFQRMLLGASVFNQNLDLWLKWVDKSGNNSEEWCDGAICDANTALFPTTTPSSVPSISQSPTENKCAGLDEESCLNEQNICKYSNQKKILGECQYKKKIYEHDCAQYTSSESCLSGFYPGMCKWIGNVCSHVCDGLSKKTCKKTTCFINVRICAMPKIKNPCLGCHLKSKC